MSALRSSRLLLTKVLRRPTTCHVINPIISTTSKVSLSSSNYHVISLGSNILMTQNQRLLSTQTAPETSEEIFDKNDKAIDVLMHSMNLLVQRSNRITTTDILSLVNRLESSENANARQYLFALRCCGNVQVDEPNARRGKLAERVWESMEKKGLKLEISHYSTLLRVHLDNNTDFQPTEILTEISRKGLQPNRVVYQHLIAKFCAVSYFLSFFV